MPPPSPSAFLFSRTELRTQTAACCRVSFQFRPVHLLFTERIPSFPWARFQFVFHPFPPPASIPLPPSSCLPPPFASLPPILCTVFPGGASASWSRARNRNLYTRPVHPASFSRFGRWLRTRRRRKIKEEKERKDKGETWPAVAYSVWETAMRSGLNLLAALKNGSSLCGPYCCWWVLQQSRLDTSKATSDRSDFCVRVDPLRWKRRCQ